MQEFLDKIFFELGLMPRILLSAVLGFLIGYERKLRSKEAGVRTHTIVCVGSALLMVISMFAFGEGSDAGRVAAQIVSGIGFLGAGIIVYRQHEVRGLTTAAGVWATAGVGMACGGGMYVIAVLSVVIIAAVQYLLHLPLFRTKRVYAVNIEFYQTENAAASAKIKEIFGVTRFSDLTLKRQEGKIYYSATLHSSKEHSSLELDEIVTENDFILSIARCENN